MRAYWPHRTDDTTGVTDYLNQVPKYLGCAASRLRLLESRAFTSGITLQRYATAA